MRGICRVRLHRVTFWRTGGRSWGGRWWKMKPLQHASELYNHSYACFISAPALHMPSTYHSAKNTDIQNSCKETSKVRCGSCIFLGSLTLLPGCYRGCHRGWEWRRLRRFLIRTFMVQTTKQRLMQCGLHGSATSIAFL